MKTLRIAALLLVGSPAWGAYQWYITTTCNNQGGTNFNAWAQTGYGASCDYVGIINGGPIGTSTTLTPVTPPAGGWGDYEVQIVGTGTLYARMSADMNSYYTLPWSTTCTNLGCSGYAYLYKVLSGSWTALGTFPISMPNGAMPLQRLIVRQNKIIVYFNSSNPYIVYDSSLPSGQPGLNVGSYSRVTSVQVGPADTVAPSAVDPATIQALTVGAFGNEVSLRWAAASDDANGIGVSEYMVYSAVGNNPATYLGATPSPQFTDETASPGTNTTYSVYTRDWHDNWSSASTKVVAVPALGTVSGFRTGVRSTGAYWGAAGEQIDLLSGDLSFSIPLLKALGRGGWGVTFSLSYNSQLWALNSAGPWNMGYDAGYGLGWRLQAGSIFPVWYGSNLDHYVYTDASGADYRLDQNSNGVWSSRDSVYVWYDSNTALLHFPDGSFWSMTVQSSAGEPDAGTLYPFLMEDSNGNQIVISYDAGAGATTINTSSRIKGIQDSRSFSGNGYLTIYSFSYSSGTPRHLTSISNSIGTAENYTFTYLAGQTLGDPFASGMAFGTTALLQSIGTTGLGVAHQFSYAAAPLGGTTGEMTSLTTPLGGNLQWTYRTFPYSGSGLSQREVQTRQMTPVSGGTQYSWSLNLDPSATSQHAWAVVTDNGTGSSKQWWFRTDSPPMAGLPSAHAEIDNTSTTLLHKDFGWTLPSGGKVYESSVLTKLNPGAAYEVDSKTTQTLDAYGNITQTNQYDYGNLTTPARTYNYTYLNNSNYAPLYIFNRLATASLYAGGVNTTLVTNYYDQTSTADDGEDLNLHDASYDTNFQYRGNVWQSVGLKGTTNASYEITGVVTAVTYPGVATAYITPADTTGYSLPGVLTPGGSGSLATSVSYASSFAVTSVSSANGAATSTTYDAYGRPATSTVADGAVTTYTYGYNPNWQTAAINSSTPRWKKTTLDGFGRTTQVQTGYGSTTVSTVDTQYAPCACSPLGKLWRTSQPYAPGDTPVWTTYTYDGSGRTLTVTAPDGSVTSYVYQGNQTTVTDPAGNWKTFTTDSFGDLITVTEPKPGGGTLTTNYTYTALNQLAGVSMTRDGNTQTRTFAWSGADMVSATNPENGTVTYTYDSAHRVSARIDAKGQKTQYWYDQYGRPTAQRHYLPDGNGGFVEQTDQYVQWYYDAYSDYTSPQTVWGRLAEVGFSGGLGLSEGGGMRYRYYYNNAGRVTTEAFHAQMPSGYWSNNSWATAKLDAQVAYSWDSEGRTTALAYPSFTLNYPGYYGCCTNTYPLGGSYQYQYDNMGRLGSMTQYDPNTQTWPTIATAAYGAANQMTSLWTSFTGTETRTYNSLLQLTRATVPGIMDMEYDYTAGQNNGRIAQSHDWISGEQVSYTYDSLQRLASATTTGTQWGEAYSYDGFGNLTGKTPTKGSAPALSVVYNPATNQPYNGNYDANGNAPVGTWDIENRLVGQTLDGTQTAWGYDPSGKRVARYQLVSGQAVWSFYLYGMNGERLGQMGCTATWGTACTSAAGQGAETYFGGKLIASTDANSHLLGATDRLGTVRGVQTNGTWAQPTYFPYGEPRTAGGVDGKEQFATYVRDSTASAQDYAGQRYYSNITGRFFSPDPGGAATADRKNPTSWNRYAYVNGDPVNQNDPNGLLACTLDGINVGCASLLQPACGSEFMNLFAGTSLYPEVTDACGENNDTPLVEGGGGPPDPVPQCPQDKRNFFNIMVPLANDLAKTWDTDANFILALSAYESGWLNQHNQDLHNPFGLTNAGGNNLNFDSYKAAADYWSWNDGLYIYGDDSIKDFASDLQPHYNTINPSWTNDVGDVYSSVLKWRDICDQ